MYVYLCVWGGGGSVCVGVWLGIWGGVGVSLILWTWIYPLQHVRFLRKKKNARAIYTYYFVVVAFVVFVFVFALSDHS